MENKEINEKNIKIIKEFIKLAKKIKYNDIELSKTNEERRKNLFRLSKIENAIKIINNYPTKINSGDELSNIPNIGKNIIKRIDEILTTGKLLELEGFDYNKKKQKSINELSKIFGIGYKNAYKLVNKYKIHTIDELIEAISKNKLKVSKLVLKSLQYHNIYKKEIPHNEITEFYNIIINIIKKINKNLICEICGSYRRNLPYSNDIDILISIKDKKDNKNYLKLVINKLKNEQIIIDSLTNEDVITKYMGFIKINDNPIHKIDIRYVSYNSYYTSLLYFTGSRNFNKEMRKIAKKLGYKLNEYGLYKNNKQIEINSEKDIFDILQMKYIEPSKRI